MKGTIMQPTYLPWMGFFEMIDATDIYVVFDHVQFVKKYWDQRNRIKTANGVIWLTIPVHNAPQETRICDVKVSYDNGNPLEKHWKTIALSYKKAPYFNEYKSIFEKIYSKEYSLLRDLNIELIETVCAILGIKTKIMFSSKMDLGDKDMNRTERVVNLCKKTGITKLYDAKGAQDLLDTSLFKKEGIEIIFQDFQHPEYPQLWGEFIPYLSVIDLLFNCGPDSIKYIKKGGTTSI